MTPEAIEAVKKALPALVKRFSDEQLDRLLLTAKATTEAEKELRQTLDLTSAVIGLARLHVTL